MSRKKYVSTEGFKTKDEETWHYRVMNAAEHHGPGFVVKALIDWMISTAPEFDPIVEQLRKLAPEADRAFADACS